MAWSLPLPHLAGVVVEQVDQLPGLVCIWVRARGADGDMPAVRDGVIEGAQPVWAAARGRGGWRAAGGDQAAGAAVLLQAPRVARRARSLSRSMA